ncbi:hypothetical protein QWZ02_09340 [Kinneretia asaccharophila]|uniref:Uncharacterized protein n=1 Tax=Roseateles asaccharophilus TaxID=582607 RepID=A0A4V3CJH1_9BURK|nr:hypothetical protein [Roseateles asaccharophilus]MDN3544650.1 hypothetical protein [Roseateles asaccharophilus]TDP09584.1 hypothetical protein DFR39_104145 [Roseateles asaccharophilus]
MMSAIEELNARAKALESLAERQAQAAERQAHALEKMAQCVCVVALAKLAETGQDSDDTTRVFRNAADFVRAGK